MQKNLHNSDNSSNFALANPRSDARVAEEARLESVYTPKGYPEFESRSLRKIDTMKINELRSNFPVSFLVYRPMNS